MAKGKQRGAFEVTAGAVETLRAKAVALGLIASSGMMMGRGSISAMLQNIADGHLSVAWAPGCGPAGGAGEGEGEARDDA